MDAPDCVPVYAGDLLYRAGRHLPSHQSLHPDGRPAGYSRFRIGERDFLAERLATVRATVAVVMHLKGLGRAILSRRGHGYSPCPCSGGIRPCLSALCWRMAESGACPACQTGRSRTGSADTNGGSGYLVRRAGLSGFSFVLGNQNGTRRHALFATIAVAYFPHPPTFREEP